MKILWHSCSPKMRTGYGGQTALVTRALRAADHEVNISCSAGGQLVYEPWHDGIGLYPHSMHGGQYGNDTVRLHYLNLRPDVIVSLIDVFALAPDVWGPLPWLPWVPVDTDPLMSRNLPALKASRRQAAMSAWGTGILCKAGFADAFHVPGAFDPAIYRICLGGQADARREFSKLMGVELGDDPLVNIVSANYDRPGRKQFGLMFRVWAAIQERHPKAWLYLHTDMDGYFSDGNDLREMLRVCGVRPGRILAPSVWNMLCGHHDGDFLALVHNAADAHLNLSVSEGFGLPIVEAQACGCPCLITDFAAGPELLGPFSQAVPGELDAALPGGMICRADYGIAVELLSAMLSERGEVDRALVAQSVADYAIDCVVERFWQPALARFAGMEGDRLWGGRYQ